MNIAILKQEALLHAIRWRLVATYGYAHQERLDHFRHLVKHKFGRFKSVIKSAMVIGGVYLSYVACMALLRYALPLNHAVDVLYDHTYFLQVGSVVMGLSALFVVLSLIAGGPDVPGYDFSELRMAYRQEQRGVCDLAHKYYAGDCSNVICKEAEAVFCVHGPDDPMPDPAPHPKSTIVAAPTMKEGHNV